MGAEKMAKNVAHDTSSNEDYQRWHVTVILQLCHDIVYAKPDIELPRLRTMLLEAALEHADFASITCRQFNCVFAVAWREVGIALYGSTGPYTNKFEQPTEADICNMQLEEKYNRAYRPFCKVECDALTVDSSGQRIRVRAEIARLRSQVETSNGRACIFCGVDAVFSEVLQQYHCGNGHRFKDGDVPSGEAAG